jgi:2-methylisocitrate lyase-like PEP mutase family enzyme
LFAPGISSAEEIGRLRAAVDRPLSVLAQRRTPSVSELADLGVSRVSVGGAFAFAALAELAEAAEELRDRGTYGYLERTRSGFKLAAEAFERRPR